MDKDLVYSRKQTQEADIITGFVDSDFVGCVDTRKSLTGFVFTMYGTAISWKAKLQGVIALSTTEVGFMSLTEAIKEAIWLKVFVNELKGADYQISVLCDNQGALQLAKNSMHYERMKHIDVRVYFIRDVVSSGLVRVEKVSTVKNASDMITKVVPSGKFNYYLKLIGLLDY